MHVTLWCLIAPGNSLLAGLDSHVVIMYEMVCGDAGRGVMASMQDMCRFKLVPGSWQGHKGFESLSASETSACLVLC